MTRALIYGQRFRRRRRYDAQADRSDFTAPLVAPLLVPIVTVALLFILVRWHPTPPASVCLSRTVTAVMATGDSSLFGGVRPSTAATTVWFTTVGRAAWSAAWSGNISAALMGMEPVSIYARLTLSARGRTHIFGETYLGYVSLLLLLPFLVLPVSGSLTRTGRLRQLSSLLPTHWRGARLDLHIYVKHARAVWRQRARFFLAAILR